MRGITDRQLQYGTAAGLGAIIGWLAATRTTLLFAYGRGGSMTLHQVQGLCDSPVGQFGRLLSTQAAGNCGSVDTWATWLNLAGGTGLILAGACAAMLLWRRDHPANSAARPPHPHGTVPPRTR